MPINIPTIQELRENIKNDFETKLNITIPTIGKNFLLTWIGVQAAKLKMIYNVLHFVNENITPDTAVSESKGGSLERWGRLKLEREPFKATNGIYNVDVTGDINTFIGAGQTFRSKDSSSSPGKLFVIDSDVTLATSPETIQLRSLETGIDSKLIVSDELFYVSPIVGLDDTAIVSSIDTSPLDSETDEDYRRKVKESFVLEPQGGAVGDFRLWSADAQGVRKAYPYATSGESANVNLFIEATVADSTDGNGTPPAQILTDVESVIELDPDTSKDLNDRGRRPLGIQTVYYLPVTPLAIDIIISGSFGFDDTIKTTIESFLEDFLYGVRPYIAGADILSEKSDILTVNLLTFVVIEAIPKDTYFNNVTMTIGGVSSSTWQFSNGDIPYLNSISYT